MLPGDKEFVRDFHDLEMEVARYRDLLAYVETAHPGMREAALCELERLEAALEAMKARARAEVRRRRAA